MYVLVMDDDDLLMVERGEIARWAVVQFESGVHYSWYKRPDVV